MLRFAASVTAVKAAAASVTAVKAAALAATITAVKDAAKKQEIAGRVA